jgi:tRNA dimethylallyltransferase
MTKTPHAIALTGPTASGKTALSIALAKEFRCEIISCDSQQIYRGMDIGTAKVTEEEKCGIPHYLTDIISPSESFSAMQYREAALPLVRDIISRGRTPLFVGGTGLYLETVCRGESPEAPESNEEYRRRMLETIKTENDRIALHKRLEAIDPESAAAIHYNNVKRVIRALEIYDTTGKPKSYFDRLSRDSAPTLTLTHLTLDFHNRENLYERIRKRVDLMLKAGLEAELDRLLALGYLTDGSTACGAIGYKEIIEGRRSGLRVEQIAENIKLASTSYAKRQLTWFRHRSGAIPFFVDTESGQMLQSRELQCRLIEAVREALPKNDN